MNRPSSERLEEIRQRQNEAEKASDWRGWINQPTRAIGELLAELDYQIRMRELAERELEMAFDQRDKAWEKILGGE